MRSDWLPYSAAALVIGAMSLVLGSLLNPLEAGASTAETLAVVGSAGARWLGMAVMFFICSLALTLGLPAVLSLFNERGRRLGLFSVGVFAVGAIGTCGYAMLMVFLRALVRENVLRAGGLSAMTHEAGLSVFVYGWVGGFYAGAVLIAVALLLARKTPRWVPLLLLLFVAMTPFAAGLGRVGQTVQVLAFAVAFTGIAISAVSLEHHRELAGRPAF